MRAITFLQTTALLATMVLAETGGHAQVTTADYDRALGLRERWQYLTENVPEPATWVGNTSRFYYRKSVRGGHQFAMVDAETRQGRPAFDHEKLAASLSKAAGGAYTAIRLPFTTFRFSDREQSIEMTFDGKWWTCSIPAYVCAPGENPRATGQPRSFGAVRDLEVPADNRRKRSPDGRLEAFISNYNVALRAVGATKLTMLSTDGSEDNFYDPESIVWSPDSKKVAAYRVKPGYRRLVHYIESSPKDQLQPRHFTQLYSKPGDVVDLDQPVVFQVEPARQLNVANDLFPNPYSLSRLAWRQDGRTVTFEYNQRGHQAYRVIEVDAATGAARAVISEESKTFVNYERRFRYEVNDGKEIIWMSERDGWNHLYLYDGVAGKVKNQITKGQWIVREVAKVDPEKRQIWFSAGGMYPGKDPYFQHYYRINFDGSGLQTLTQADAYHDVSFSSDMKYYVDTYSRIDLPAVSELHRAGDGSLVATLERGDISALIAAGWKAPESFVAPGRDGKTEIWGIIIRPTNFDPSKRYPVIENIYAGPHSSFVPKTFRPFLPHSSGDSMIGMQAQAELGFIVVMIDGMGTLNRSKAFHDVAWKNVGDAGFPDRILWHKAVAAKYPYYDITRVGIYGGSAGGQNSLGGLLFHPDFYKVAVSYAGCHDNRMDKIVWNERWMGWPVGPEYSESSNVDNAWRLQGKVLLVFGELDQNVDPSSTMQVVNALIKANKMFDLLVIPGEGHGAGRSAGPVEYGSRRQYDFFVRNLAGVEPPDWNHILQPQAIAEAR